MSKKKEEIQRYELHVLDSTIELTKLANLCRPILKPKGDIYCLRHVDNQHLIIEFTHPPFSVLNDRTIENKIREVICKYCSCIGIVFRPPQYVIPANTLGRRISHNDLFVKHQ